jgi:hypothetical protein
LGKWLRGEGEVAHQTLRFRHYSQVDNHGDHLSA